MQLFTNQSELMAVSVGFVSRDELSDKVSNYRPDGVSFEC